FTSLHLRSTESRRRTSAREDSPRWKFSARRAAGEDTCSFHRELPSSGLARSAVFRTMISFAAGTALQLFFTAELFCGSYFPLWSGKTSAGAPVVSAAVLKTGSTSAGVPDDDEHEVDHDLLVGNAHQDVRMLSKFFVAEEENRQGQDIYNNCDEVEPMHPDWGHHVVVIEPPKNDAETKNLQTVLDNIFSEGKPRPNYPKDQPWFPWNFETNIERNIWGGQDSLGYALERGSCPEKGLLLLKEMEQKCRSRASSTVLETRPCSGGKDRQEQAPADRNISDEILDDGKHKDSSGRRCSRSSVSTGGEKFYPKCLQKSSILSNRERPSQDRQFARIPHKANRLSEQLFDNLKRDEPNRISVNNFRDTEIPTYPGREFDRSDQSRVQVLFKPGNYRDISITPGYYQAYYGLGETADQVKIQHLQIPNASEFTFGPGGTCNFWRSVENMRILGAVNAAVSQA
ncbi:unnamed protein product, partial [Amoebophrya sp. A120]